MCIPMRSIVHPHLSVPENCGLKFKYKRTDYPETAASGKRLSFNQSDCCKISGVFRPYRWLQRKPTQVMLAFRSPHKTVPKSPRFKISS